MTGSASMRWTFCIRAKAYVKGRGLGKGGQSDSFRNQAGGLPPKPLIFWLGFFGSDIAKT